MACGPAAIPCLLALLLVSFTAGAGAAVFTITNWCPSTVYAASSKGMLGLGIPLPRGETMHTGAVAGRNGAIWGRTGCALDADGHLSCETGDCAGQQLCEVPKPPATLAEFRLGDSDGDTVGYYDLSVADGFNVPMSFGCYDDPRPLLCMDPGCRDEGKVRTCPADSGYYVVFCPAA